MHCRGEDRDSEQERMGQRRCLSQHLCSPSPLSNMWYVQRCHCARVLLKQPIPCLATCGTHVSLCLHAAQGVNMAGGRGREQQSKREIKREERERAWRPESREATSAPVKASLAKASSSWQSPASDPILLHHLLPFAHSHDNDDFAPRA